MIYGCIGEKLSHSYSREIHSKAGGYPYELCEVAREDFDAFMKKRDFRGINVTIPYKEAVMPYLSYTDEAAARIGAVNTVINKDGRLYGYNTDYTGMKMLLERYGIDIQGKKVIILGTGGTSKTAAALTAALGAGETVKVSRSGKDGAVTYEECAGRHRDAQIIINTTPCGMFPDNGKTPVDIGLFPDCEGVADVIYNPLRTALVQSAQKRGIKAAGGLYMLVSQAVYAAHYFTGAEPADTDKIYSEIAAEKENIVLIGMPSSGKSSVGREIAVKTGRAFIDTDSEIIKNEGLSIPQIFEKYGEGYFREAEAKACADAGRKSSCVIATGGGAVLREDNVSALRQNGRLYFLDRPPESLIPTDDRPLAQTGDAIKELYQKRLPVYQAAADAIVKISGGIRESAADVLNIHNGEKR